MSNCKENVKSHRRTVLRAWAILNGFDPDELEADIAKRTEEIKAEIEKDLRKYGYKPKSQ